MSTKSKYNKFYTRIEELNANILCASGRDYYTGRTTILSPVVSVLYL